MHTADGEANRAAWEIEKIASQGEVFRHKRVQQIILDSGVHEMPRGRRIVPHTKRIECTRRVGIKYGDAQIVKVRHQSEDLPRIDLVPADTELPFPCLQFVPSISKLAEIAF